MKKTLALIIAIGIILSSSFCIFINTVSAESIYIRKIVSVVYDDSGSMGDQYSGEKWAYANYAMQAFCGMLNSEDRLFITYMAPASYGLGRAEEMDLSAGGIQASVDSIRNHSDSNSTPFSAVELAFDKLKSTQDDNPNTRYWLVIITDGAFDGYQYSSTRDLDRKFESYTDETMPNGSHPQISYLRIGQYTVEATTNEQKGIFDYSCPDADSIFSTMSEMADRISGRTRLERSDLKLVDAHTLQVSSAIPILNIAILSQHNDADIVDAVYSNEVQIPVSRKADLWFKNRAADLEGEAFLLGDSKNVIGPGTYNISFDKPIDLNNIVVLFEPALEVRMEILVNGKPISDRRELDDLHEGDEISLHCGIYEMGTDNELPLDILPPGTKLDINIFEDGNLVSSNNGTDTALDSYTLKHIKTKLLVSLKINGFNPIETYEEFEPGEFVKVPEYRIEHEYLNGNKSIKLSDVGIRQDLAIMFTVFEDGAPLTDPAKVRALNLQITTDVPGNNGSMDIDKNGKLVFIPASAAVPAGASAAYTVNVTCTLGTVSDTADYTVLLADYQVIAEPVNGQIVKTEFYDNKLGASFYITKDGVRLGKQDVENQFNVQLDEDHDFLLVHTSVEPDGTITCIPYSDTERVLDFWGWASNWWYYFGIPNSPVKVQLNHAYGSAVSEIPVVRAPFDYELKNVYAPLIAEILLFAMIVAYVIRYITKPRFAKNGELYVGSIVAYNNAHMLNLTSYSLKDYNKFRYLANPFKPLRVMVGGLDVEALKGGKIFCYEPLPWYASDIKPIGNPMITHPDHVVRYCSESGMDLRIKKIKKDSCINEQKRISPSSECYYFSRAVADDGGTIGPIDSATAFCYAAVQRNR